MLPELLNLIMGIVFGFIHRGKEDYTGLLKSGALAGLLLGIIFVLAAQFFVPAWKIDLGFGVFEIFIEILVYLIIFIIGVFIGDRIECSLRKKQ